MSAVEFAPDGRTMITAGHDHSLRFVDVAPLLAGRAEDVTSLVFSPDGELLVSMGVDGTIRVLDIADPRSPERLSAPWVQASHARLWEVTDPRSPRQVSDLADGSSSAVFSPDGRTLVLAGEGVEFSPDGRVLASAVDTTLRLWNVADPRDIVEIATVEGHARAITALAFNPDGHTVATAAQDGFIRLWDADIERTADHVRGVPADHRGPVGAVLPRPGLPAAVPRAAQKAMRLPNVVPHEFS